MTLPLPNVTQTKLRNLHLIQVKVEITLKMHQREPTTSSKLRRKNVAVGKETKILIHQNLIEVTERNPKRMLLYPRLNLQLK
jgi:hypothetical protein